MGYGQVYEEKVRSLAIEYTSLANEFTYTVACKINTPKPVLQILHNDTVIQDNDEWDFGSVNHGSEATVRFKFLNTGQGHLLIESVSAGVGSLDGPLFYNGNELSLFYDIDPPMVIAANERQ